jgi:hypothetical protein
MKGLITKQMTHPKHLKSLLQSCLAILEQFAHLALMEKFLELIAILLSFNKCVDFMEGPDSSGQYQGEFFFSQSPATYSVNFPICFSTLSGNSPSISELM